MNQMMKVSSKINETFFRLFSNTVKDTHLWQMIEKKLQIKVNSLDDFEVAIGNTILALANFFS